MTRRPLIWNASWDANGPLIEGLHVYETEIALRALADDPDLARMALADDPAPSNPAPKEVPVTAHSHQPYSSSPDVAVLNGAINELAPQVQRLKGDVHDLKGLLHDLETAVAAHVRYIGELVDRIVALEESATKPKAARDETNEKLVAYLATEAPGVWLNATSVAVNLNLDAKSVSSRLDRLSRQQGSHVERRGGKGTGAASLYRVVPLPKPEA